MPTLRFETALLPGGWANGVRISHASGRIAAVEIGAQRTAGEAGGAIGLPGLSNLHSHAFQRAMAGLAETASPGEDDFWSWREAMYRLAGRMDPEDLRAVAALAFAEMLESGFTRVGEFHYLHRDRDGAPFADPAEMARAIAEAAAETGIGLTLLPVFYAHGGFGGAPAGERQRRFLSSAESYAELLAASRRAVADLPDAVVGIAPHSLRAVTPEALAAIAPLAGCGPIHIHIAEQTREVDDCLAWSGSRPVDWLLDHAEVDERWCLVHATHMTEAETDRLAVSGAVAGLCPITEANLGDGLFPARRFLDARGRFGVGSDSNVRIDAAEELRWLEYGQRLIERKRARLAAPKRASIGASLYVGALAGGAQALSYGGFDFTSPPPGFAGSPRVARGENNSAGRPSGSSPAPAGEGDPEGVEGARRATLAPHSDGSLRGLAPGAPADIICLDPDHPSLADKRGDPLLDAFVFAVGRDAIDRVWRAGVEVVSDGRHRRRDEIAARYRNCLTRLLA